MIYHRHHYVYFPFFVRLVSDRNVINNAARRHDCRHYIWNTLTLFPNHRHDYHFPTAQTTTNKQSKMADIGDDLVDYEEEEELTTVPVITKKAAAAKLAANGDAGKDKTKEVKKGSYVGIHSTGFRDFLLKPELLRAIVDCGFEHPSEGMCHAVACVELL